MAKVNTIANNGLTIVENYNKLLEQFRKTKTIDDVRILVANKENSSYGTRNARISKSMKRYRAKQRAMAAC